MEIPSHWKRFEAMPESEFRQKFNQGRFGQSGGTGYEAAAGYLAHRNEKRDEEERGAASAKADEDAARAERREDKQVTKQDRHNFVIRVGLYLIVGATILTIILNWKP